MEEALLIALLFVEALAACAIASTKGRDPALWIIVGAVVPVVGLVTITLLPPRPSLWADEVSPAGGRAARISTQRL